MNNKSWFEYVGNLHIHSLYSDGTGSVREIAQSAKRVGLDFIILNDHAHMTDSLHLEEEGYYDDLLVLLGLEIGGRYHHCLAFDMKEMVAGQSLGPQEVIDSVNGQKGLCFLAHPFEKGMPFMERSIAYTWNDLSVDGYTGICIWNFSSRWKERVSGPLHGLFLLLFKSQMLKGPSRKTLSFWDASCQHRRVVAIGGSDAHASSFRWGPVHFTPLVYDHLLGSIDVHILLDVRLPTDPAEAKQEVYGALRQGRLFIAHENLGPARGFRFYYVSEGGLHLTMGEEGPFKPGELFIKTPSDARIRLLRDGSVQKEWHGREASFSVNEAGVYRVEAYRRISFFGLRPWIFSNPIYLR